MARTFIQKGQAYGNVACNITAKIDGAVVFSGEVPTANTPIPLLPNSTIDIGVDLFSWSKPVDFSGSCELEIAVDDATLMITDTTADYTSPQDLSRQSDGFYIVEIDEVKYGDPFTDVKINGVAQIGPYDPATPGQWYWRVDPGSVFTATVNINAGQLPPTPPTEE
jgi:hypothetical protein